MCRWILEDLKRHGKLTGWPNDYSGGAVFPVHGKLNHLALENVDVGDVKLLTS